MTKEKYDCYLVKQEDGTLLKFCYDSQQGIYYQIFINHRWSDKKIIYKECFKYFYVLEELNGKIHVFCQDICGDIILCTLEEIEWSYKILLHMKYDTIMPIYIRAFFYSTDIHLLYNIVDRYTYSEVLVHQIAHHGTSWSCPQIITKLDYYRFPYRISQDCKSNLIVLNTMLAGVYKLTTRSFYISEGRWGKQEVIHTSVLPYIDFTFCIEENRSHYLFITQEGQVKSVIYQYKEIGLQKNTTLFQHEQIDSCLLRLSNEILSAMWICGDKLYGCISTDYGQNFSSPRIYRNFYDGLPVKVFYQEYLKNKQNTYIFHEIYVVNLKGEEKLFSQEHLENSVAATQLHDSNNLKTKTENSSCDMEKLRNYFAKVKILKKEKENLQAKLKKAEEEQKRLNETRKYEKNQMLKLQYQFYEEKEKIKLFMNDKYKLREKNSYLEKKLLLMDKEKTSIEKKLAEKERENKYLKQQIEVIKNQNLSNSEKAITESTDHNSGKESFSLIKWLFDDENKTHEKE